MEHSSDQPAPKFSPQYPPPPRLHWAVLLVVALAAEALVVYYVPRPYRELLVNLIAAAWPIYLCVWIRKIDGRSSSLYWALASLATGFLFSWVLWIVVIFEIREELLEHYNRREPIGLRLNFVLSLLFSFIYFQYELNRIAKEKAQFESQVVAESEGSVPA